jgi:hypothetical protein
MALRIVWRNPIPSSCGDHCCPGKTWPLPVKQMIPNILATAEARNDLNSI